MKSVCWNFCDQARFFLPVRKISAHSGLRNGLFFNAIDRKVVMISNHKLKTLRNSSENHAKKKFILMKCDLNPIKKLSLAEYYFNKYQHLLGSNTLLEADLETGKLKSILGLKPNE